MQLVIKRNSYYPCLFLLIILYFIFKVLNKSENAAAKHISPVIEMIKTFFFFFPFLVEILFILK